MLGFHFVRLELLRWEIQLLPELSPKPGYLEEHLVPSRSFQTLQSRWQLLLAARYLLW